MSVQLVIIKYVIKTCRVGEGGGGGRRGGGRREEEGEEGRGREEEGGGGGGGGEGEGGGQLAADTSLAELTVEEVNMNCSVVLREICSDGCSAL